MSYNSELIPNHAATAVADFREARRQAALNQMLSRLTGRSTELLSFESVTKQLKLTGSAERGLHDIPLEAIAGSVGRTNDYTRDFLPRRDDDEERWSRVRAAVTDPSAGGMPPIQVYQVGGAYFVIDGHHRVSVARQLGATHIQAYVTEIRTRATLSADADPEEVIVQAEYAELLECTQLDRKRPGADLQVTVAGQAEHLLAQIAATQEQMAAEAGQEVDFPTAAADWYDKTYLPVIYLVRETGMRRDFPDRTEADLYLLLTQHRQQLEKELGWQITPEAGAASLAASRGQRAGGVRQAGRRILAAMVPDELKDGPAPGTWRSQKLSARYADRLFADLLVPLSGEAACWQALEQALPIAQREGALVHGLHVVRRANQMKSSAVMALKAEFEKRCAEAGVRGAIAIETGDVARTICARAALSDLIVLSLAHPPEIGMRSRLGSGMRTIVRRSPRPVLAVPAPGASVPRCAVLAYDGSPKAEEALFVAAYLAESWKTRIVVVTILDGDRATPDTIAHARDYLAMHECEATIITREAGPAAAAILETAIAEQSDLLILGGYGSAPMIEAVVGSQVDQVLRGSRLPVLICR